MMKSRLERRLRFWDLVELGIRNRPCLQSWIRSGNFPPGRLVGANSRSWAESEIEAWLAKRPTASKPIPPSKRPRGRPRKSDTAHPPQP